MNSLLACLFQHTAKWHTICPTTNNSNGKNYDGYTFSRETTRSDTIDLSDGGQATITAKYYFYNNSKGNEYISIRSVGFEIKNSSDYDHVDLVIGSLSNYKEYTSYSDNQNYIVNWDPDNALFITGCNLTVYFKDGSHCYIQANISEGIDFNDGRGGIFG